MSFALLPGMLYPFDNLIRNLAWQSDGWAQNRPLDIPLQCNYNVLMAGVRIEWDEGKNRANMRKHGISFQEAATVFVDERAILIADPEHSDDEDRFLLLGTSAALQTLVVCHCYKQSAEVIRIISARRASRKERATYERRWLE